MKNSLRIKIVKWQDHHEVLMMIRQKVFIKEQQVSPELEWDDMDESAIHFLAYHDETPIGCARAIVNPQELFLGRMAVLKEKRKQGVGRALLEYAITMAKLNHLISIHISAQCDAIDFYMPFGFKVVSEIYLDANIPHRDMKLEF